MNNPHPIIGVIGIGRFGSHLVHSLKQLNYPVTVYLRQTTQSLETWAETCDCLCLAVRDDQITDCVTALAAAKLEGRSVLIHSGATPLTHLTPLSERGALIGKFHPLQAFTKASEAPIPKGTPFAVEGETTLAEDWAAAWQCPIYRLSGDDWKRYHLAAVMAANFLPLFVRAGAELLQDLAKDQDDALQWLAPLVETTIRGALDPKRDLPYSGPAIRGDQQTIANHLDILKQSTPHLLDLYEVATERILGLRPEPKDES